MVGFGLVLVSGMVGIFFGVGWVVYRWFEGF